MPRLEILEQARDTFTVRRVYGEPIERDGLLLVPAATLSGGAGAGTGEGRKGEESAPGTGATSTAACTMTACPSPDSPAAGT